MSVINLLVTTVIVLFRLERRARALFVYGNVMTSRVRVGTDSELLHTD